MTLKQVFIINKDLKMRAGKIAVQVAHGETLYMKEIGTCRCFTAGIIKHNNKEEQMKDNFKEWTKDGLMKKIVLKATQQAMLMFVEATKVIVNPIWFDVVYDKGFTQIPTDSMTCIVFEPLDEEEADKRFGHLKLL